MRGPSKRNHEKESITRSIAGCLRFLILIQCAENHAYMPAQLMNEIIKAFYDSASNEARYTAAKNYCRGGQRAAQNSVLSRRGLANAVWTKTLLIQART